MAGGYQSHAMSYDVMGGHGMSWTVIGYPMTWRASHIRGQHCIIGLDCVQQFDSRGTVTDWFKEWKEHVTLTVKFSVYDGWYHTIVRKTRLLASKGTDQISNANKFVLDQLIVETKTVFKTLFGLIFDYEATEFKVVFIWILSYSPVLKAGVLRY